MSDPHFQYGISLIFQKIAFIFFGKPTLFGQTNIAIENCPFIVDLPIKNGDFP